MLASLALAVTAVQAAAPPVNTEFDFWVGKWSSEGRMRSAPGKDEWTVTKGTNIIKKQLKNQVIEENFSMTGFAGRSWTMYHAPSKTWRQTWVDDSGAYLTFTGGWNAETKQMILTQTFPQRGEQFSRMVFRDFTKTGFTWDWQLSTDNQKTWETQWLLTYKRK
ncbi:MAG: hypothetical protein JNJ45_04875 [Chthonomonas sp.]|nr:hypothetical protein [Chthonomonas sp.]